MFRLNDKEKPLVQQEDVVRHNCNVSQLSSLIAEKMGLSLLETRKVACCAMYHDIGKGLIDQDILYKTEKLNKQEFEEIKKHTVRGAEYMKKNKHLRAFSDYILFHHENYDGSGYFGLKGDKIPLISRIIRAADYFDALLEDRPYREAKSLDEALTIIKNDSKVFDPDVLFALLELTNEKRLELFYEAENSKIYHAAL